MSTTTKNLGLFKYDIVADENVPFSITNALNNNWDILDEKCGSQRNIGEIVASTLPLTDGGLHLLDGALISGSGIYSEFVEYIANLYTENPNAAFFAQPTEGRTAEQNWQGSVETWGVCGKFVYNSTNNTVRLPKITGIIEGTTDVSALGNLVQAGLPLSWFEHKHTRGDMNITGSVIFTETGDSDKSTIRSSSGAFTNTGGYGGGWGQIQPTDQNWVQRLDFDASRNWTGSTSTPNYTTSNHDASTVQPQTIKCFIYIVIATSTKTDIQVDIDEIATDLNGKADVDLTNCTKPHVVESYQNGNAWYRLYSDGWCIQGSTVNVTTSGIVTVSLLKPMVSYQVFKNYGGGGSGEAVALDAEVSCFNKTSTSFETFNTAGDTLFFDWHAVGWTR